MLSINRLLLLQEKLVKQLDGVLRSSDRVSDRSLVRVDLVVVSTLDTQNG